MRKYDYYDIEAVLGGSYRCMINDLLKKYGPVPYDYFTNESCKTHNVKNSRTKEGLFIHHVCENKAIMLSDPEYAIESPFEYQKANKLVYCNLLEHLILHYLITKEALNKKPSKLGIMPGLGGAINNLIPMINDYYAGKEVKNHKLYEVLDDNFEGYIRILVAFRCLAIEFFFMEKRLKKERLAKGSNGKIVDKIYKELENIL